MSLTTDLFRPRLVSIWMGDSTIFRSFGWNGSSWVYENALLDGLGATIPGSQPPVAKAWPDSPLPEWPAAEKRTVAILPSSTGKMHLYVLNYDSNRWERTQGGGDLTTNGKPFLEYRTVRNSNGVRFANLKGHFMIGYLENNARYGNRAKVVFSTLVSRTSPPGNPDFSIQNSVGDFLQDRWATVREGSSPSLYSDSTIDNVFGVTPLSVPTETVGLYYYPHADGSPDAEFRVYSDFRVMEDYICQKIGDVRDFECGSIDVMD